MSNPESNMFKEIVYGSLKFKKEEEKHNISAQSMGHFVACNVRSPQKPTSPLETFLTTFNRQ